MHGVKKLYGRKKFRKIAKPFSKSFENLFVLTIQDAQFGIVFDCRFDCILKSLGRIWRKICGIKNFLNSWNKSLPSFCQWDKMNGFMRKPKNFS